MTHLTELNGAVKLFMLSYNCNRGQRMTKEKAFGLAATYLRGTTIDQNVVNEAIDILVDHAMHYGERSLTLWASLAGTTITPESCPAVSNSESAST